MFIHVQTGIGRSSHAHKHRHVHVFLVGPFIRYLRAVKERQRVSGCQTDRERERDMGSDWLLDKGCRVRCGTCT